MKNYVITIARENGSNGRAIGEALAGRLGIPFYNRDILRMAADDSGINEQLFANAEKSFRSSLLFRVAKDAYNGEVIPPDSDNFVSNENLFQGDAGPGAERELCDDRPLRGLYFARPAQCAACVHPRAGGSARAPRHAAPQPL